MAYPLKPIFENPERALKVPVPSVLTSIAAPVPSPLTKTVGLIYPEPPEIKSTAVILPLFIKFIPLLNVPSIFLIFIS